ncbi:MAG TPA: adenylyl-sulfate kinase [Mycobacteriales bacterium]
MTTLTSPDGPRTDDPLTGAGGTVWLTGLPSAGKTTIAHAVADRLRPTGRRVEVLDGDAVRETLSAGLGFSRADRDANVERIGFVAELLARNGVLVLAAVISPYARARQRVRDRHVDNGTTFVQVHVATPVTECSARDVKGLYARARSGDITGLTGVDDPYEPPADPDLRLDTAGRSVSECVQTVLAVLAGRGLA